MARTMTIESNGVLSIQLKPYESLTGLVDFKTHVKRVRLYEPPGLWTSIRIDTDKEQRHEWLYFPRGAVITYKEKKA